MNNNQLGKHIGRPCGYMITYTNIHIKKGARNKFTFKLGICVKLIMPTINKSK